MEIRALRKKVIRDYASIAEEFDTTRQRSWPEFEIFLEYFLPKSNCSPDDLITSSPPHLLDVGCGNGRLYDFFRTSNIVYTGVDNNRKLLDLAEKQYSKASFLHGDILRLPFSPATFDTAWCIAVLHHMPSRTLQKKALRELGRVTKKGGPIMLTVWNLWQKKYQAYINARTGEALIPWGKEKKVHRYYHAFRDTELRSLISECGLSIVHKVPSDHNLAYICLNSHEKSKNS